MLLPSKRMSPGAACRCPVMTLKTRRLAGAVGPDHADDLVLVDLQVEVVQRRAGRRRTRQTWSSSSSGAIRRPRRAASPSSPCGRAAIVTIRIAPIMICAVIAGSTLRRASQQHAAT